jgi:hypothetical protein
MIARNKLFIFYTDQWGCVTVIGKRRAVTYAHSSLAIGTIISIYSMDENTPIHVRVLNLVKVDPKRICVILESDVDLCEKEPVWSSIYGGLRYFQFGLSARDQENSPFAISTGVITSQNRNENGHLLGSAGANPGDSGGGCFGEYGTLIGINVGSEALDMNEDKYTLTTTFNKIATRYASRAHIIPIDCFRMF